MCADTSWVLARISTVVQTVVQKVHRDTSIALCTSRSVSCCVVGDRQDSYCSCGSGTAGDAKTELDTSRPLSCWVMGGDINKYDGID